MPLGASYKLADGEQLLGESDDTSGPWGNGTSIPDWVSKPRARNGAIVIGTHKSKRS